ncbi:MAG: redoxin domain-containing protein [Armatimonadetes bacterium]|nr:redoxin domain-containing protein [Armatimonadota bacterium]
MNRQWRFGPAARSGLLLAVSVAVTACRDVPEATVSAGDQGLNGLKTASGWQDSAGKPSDKAAADFSAGGSDGKTYTLASFDATKPLVLVFIKDGCGAVPTSFPFFNAIAEAFQGDKAVQYVGVIDDDAEAFAKWSSEHKPRFTFLLDPDKKIIGAYGVEASNEVKIVVGGKLTKHYKGFSKKSFTEIGKTLASVSTGGKGKDLDFSRAPERERFG